MAAQDQGTGLEIPIREESGLHLYWQGRKSFRSRIPTPRVLEPQPDLSFRDDDRNLVIEGDNLQVMISLRTQFSESVDVVFIDPPYNRGGNDFRYSDARFDDPDADNSDAKYVSNEDGGRHTKWLNYMAPRLAAIHGLMADHGVIFVTINDIELGRLLVLMDELFDEKNRIGVIAWKGSADNNPSRIAIEHEYIVCYAKREKRVPKVWSTPTDDIKEALLEHYDQLCAEVDDFEVRVQEWKKYTKANKTAMERLGRYTEVDPDKGPYQVAYRVHNPKKGGYVYGVHQDGVIAADDPRSYALPLNGYRFPPSTMEKLIEEGLLVFPEKREQIVQMKDFLRNYRGTLRSVINLDARSGAYRLQALFGDEFDEFRNPKPPELVEMLVGAAGGKDALVLDCFAGSGTTGDAVMSLNKLDGGSRRFILVEEGNGEDLYARTLIAPRLKLAAERDGFPEGFTFMTTGKQLDRDAILGLEREKIAAVICQTDRSGAGSGIGRLAGHRWLIGANRRGEAIALVWDGDTHSEVTPEIINEALAEVARSDLKTPMRIYGTTCVVSETKQFRFCQIPDEILASLYSTEHDHAAEPVS